jgi:hypothetical protein
MAAQENALHIDIPVTLTEVKIVFSVASLSLEGDLPASLFHRHLIVDDIPNWKARSQVVVVLHTNAGHVTLHNQAYNPDVMLPVAPIQEACYPPDGARDASRTVRQSTDGDGIYCSRGFFRFSDSVSRLHDVTPFSRKIRPLCSDACASSCFSPDPPSRGQATDQSERTRARQTSCGDGARNTTFSRKQASQRVT